MEGATPDEASLRAALQANPADDAALAGLARLALARRGWSEAADLLRTAVSARPDESEYHLLLGETLWNSAEERAAVTATSAGGGGEPGGNEARATGRAAAYTEWLQAGKLSPGSADAFRCLGYFFAGFQGIIPRAGACGTQHGDGRHAEAWWAAGERKRARKGGVGEEVVRDVGRAVKCFQKAVSVNPEDQDAGEAAFHLLAGGRGAVRQRSLQVALCRGAVEGSTRAFWAWRLLGLLHAEEAAWQSAVPCLQSAIKGFVRDASHPLLPSTQCHSVASNIPISPSERSPPPHTPRHPRSSLQAYGRVITLGLPHVASALEALVPASVALATASPPAESRGGVSSSDVACAVFALEQSGHIELERSNYSQALELFSYAEAQRAGSATVQWGLAAARYGLACHVASFGAAAWANDLLLAAAASARASISHHPTSATTWKLLGDIELRHSAVLLAAPSPAHASSTTAPASPAPFSLLTWRRHRFRLASSALRSYAHALHLSPSPSAPPPPDSPHLSSFLSLGVPEAGGMGGGEVKGAGGQVGGRLWADLALAAAAKGRAWAELVEAGGGGEEKEVECGNAGGDGQAKAEVLDAACVDELRALPPRLLLPALQGQQSVAGAHAWVVLAAVVGWQWPEVQQHALVHALMLDPLHALAWVLLGEVYLHQKQSKLATQAFARARVADPFIAAPWVASAACQLGALAAAPAANAPHTNPPDAAATAGLSSTRNDGDAAADSAGDDDGESRPSLHAAMADALFAATACSNPPPCAQHVLGQLSARCGRLGQAEVFCALAHLASSSPASPEALFLLGLSACARGLPSVTLHAFQSAKQLLLQQEGPAERVWLAYVQVGMALTAARRFSEALVEFNSAHSLRDRSKWPVRPLLALALTLHHCSLHDDALAVVALATTQATHLAPSPSPSPSSSSSSSSHSLLSAAAVKLHAALLASPPALPSSPAPPASLAPSLFLSPSLARDLALTRVDVSLTALAAAAASLDEGEIGRAVQQYRPVFSDPLMAPRAHALLGVSLAAKGQLPRALKYLIRSLHHFPDSLLLRACLADLLSPSHPARAARIIGLAPQALSSHPPPPHPSLLTTPAPPDRTTGGSAAGTVEESVVRVQASTRLACSACAGGTAHGAGACLHSQAPLATPAAVPGSSGSSSSGGSVEEGGARESHLSGRKCLLLPDSPSSANQKAALRACAECQVARCHSLQQPATESRAPPPVTPSFPASLLPSLASASSLFSSGFYQEAEAVVAALQAQGLQGQGENKLLLMSVVQMWQAVIGAEKGEMSEARSVLEGVVGSLKEAAGAGGMSGAAVQPLLDVAHVLLGTVDMPV
ncbi:unnamed protein product [Closterium sp. NIES-65]|nr:unnamed protein product [Closterium sp. NIES-65]